MTYVIGEPCIDVVHRACVDECPVGAVHYEGDLPTKCQMYTEHNARFFREPLPGRAKQLGSPGRAARLGPLARTRYRPSSVATVWLSLGGSATSQ